MEREKKLVVSISEQHKAWFARIIDYSAKKGQDTNQTEIMRVVFDRVGAIDDETFVALLDERRVQTQLESISRRKQALQQEEEELMAKVKPQETGKHKARKEGEWQKQPV